MYTRNKKQVEKHLGFAFVQFEDKAEAEKAIETFNGKEFKGRNIYVKRALPVPTPEEKEKKVEAFKAKRAEKLSQAKATKAKKQPKQTPKKTAKNGSSVETSAKKSESESTEDKSSSEEPKAKIPEGKPSTDTIFITNLDYKVDVKTLNGIFKEYNPKWIHVPTKRVPFHILKRQRKKGRTVFNKGIAFIKFPSEEVQKKAIAEFNGKELNGRQIIVDIAVDARNSKEDGEGESGEDAEEKPAELSNGKSSEKSEDKSSSEEKKD